MGGTGSSLLKPSTYSIGQSNNFNFDRETTRKTLLFTECTTDLDLKCIKGLLHSLTPLFRIHVTMPEFTNMEKIVDMTIIKHLNKDLFFHAMDVSNDASIEEVVENISKMESRLDILVCSFDARTTSCFESASMDEVTSSFSRNLFSHIRVVQKVIPIMKTQRRGDIIVLSNVAGLQGIPYHTTYCAARFAVEGFYESMAAECFPHNIRVTILETAIQKGSEIASLDLMVDKRLALGSSHDETSMKTYIENKLVETELKKRTKPEKVVEAIKDIANSWCHNSMRRYLNKAALNLAKSQFNDVKGIKQLNETLKFFLNTEMDTEKGSCKLHRGIMRRTKTF